MQRLWRSAVYLLAPNGLLILLSCSIKDHLLMGGTPHDDLAILHQPSNMKIPNSLLTGQSYKDIFLIKILSSQVTTACVKLTLKKYPNKDETTSHVHELAELM